MNGNDRHAIVIADSDGHISYWNDGAEELFGYPAAVAVGALVDLIVPDEFKDKHWEGFQRVMAGGERHLDGAKINLPVKLAGGEVLAFPARFVLLADARDHVIGAMAIYSARTGDEQPWSPVDPHP